VVRLAQHQEQTFLYVVNDSPNSAAVTLRLSCSAATSGRILGHGQDLKLQPASEHGSVLRLKLAPYAAWACSLHHPLVQVLDSQSQLGASALADIKARIEQAEQKMSLVQGQPRLDASPLPNPGFELAGTKSRDLPGWNVPTESAVGWSLDSENPRSGRTALRLTANEEPAALLSPELPLADSRFLTMSLWLRTDRSTATVRLAFEAEFDGRPQIQEAVVEVGPQWQRYLFRVRNLPPQGLQNARIRVEMQRPGRLWIDDVEIHRQRFTPDDVRQLTKSLSAARLAWDEQRYADCQRLLDGYWGRFLLEDDESAPTVEGSIQQIGNHRRGLFRRK
jgi:hypothetical protein